jgi:hypothetical protein
MNPKSNPPADENEIDSLLKRFKPQPSQRFYQRMQAAPWQNLMIEQPSSSKVRRKTRLRLAWSLAILLVIILVSSAILIPPVRAIARQIIYSFIAAPSNQIEVQVTLSSPGDLFNYSDPSNFQLTPEEVQSLAGFRVRQISPLPAGLNLLGARFDPYYNAVVLLYQADHFTLFLTQRPLENSQDVFSVGEQAVVEIVKIGDVQGEFVQGGWKSISTQEIGESQTPGNQLAITAVWDNALPQSTLRWQAGKMAYELRALGEGGPQQSDLILWANELK